MARKSAYAYAQAGVNPAQIGKFKDLMKAVGKRTLSFPSSATCASSPEPMAPSFSIWANQHIGTLGGARF